MSSISKINEQLVRVGIQIDFKLEDLNLGIQYDQIESVSKSIEALCKAQRALVETQVIIFVECTESDIDMPTLPLFCEERNEEDGIS